MKLTEQLNEVGLRLEILLTKVKTDNAVLFAESYKRLNTEFQLLAKQLNEVDERIIEPERIAEPIKAFVTEKDVESNKRNDEFVDKFKDIDFKEELKEARQAAVRPKTTFDNHDPQTIAKSWVNSYVNSDKYVIESIKPDENYITVKFLIKRGD